MGWFQSENVWPLQKLETLTHVWSVPETDCNQKFVLLYRIPSKELMSIPPEISRKWKSNFDDQKV